MLMLVLKIISSIQQFIIGWIKNKYVLLIII